MPVLKDTKGHDDALLAALLRERGPRRFEVRSAVPPSVEPLRAACVLRRKSAETTEPAGTLRRLWDLLSRHTLVELESIGRPYRGRSLDRLCGFLHLYFASEPERMQQRSDLCGVLLVPSRTPSLDADAADLGLTWYDLGDGYWQLRGGVFALVVAEVDIVAEAEHDDLLRLFGHDEVATPRARRWLLQQIGAMEVRTGIQDLEGFDEVLRKLLVNLPPEQVLPALPDDVLRALSDAYLDSLSKETRATIRARVGR
ncbi:hypothetical protein WMF20_20425 [Sorangium sp. So ce834]|uniref:hypothetical protein n=1 Tax=Sorangium sp. So ce834 TaxID=3133321 RepID=UPI003F5D7E7C